MPLEDRRGYTIIELLFSIQLSVLVFILIQQITIMILTVNNDRMNMHLLHESSTILRSYLTESIGYKFHPLNLQKDTLTYLDNDKCLARIVVKDFRLYTHFGLLLNEQIKCTQFSIKFLKHQRGGFGFVTIDEADLNGDGQVLPHELQSYPVVELHAVLFFYRKISHIKYSAQIITER